MKLTELVPGLPGHPTHPPLTDATGMRVVGETDRPAIDAVKLDPSSDGAAVRRAKASRESATGGAMSNAARTLGAQEPDLRRTHD